MDLQCSICLCPLKDENNEICSSICGHIFHHNCIVDWIQRSETCPDCRSPLTRQSIFKLYLFSAESLSQPSLELEIDKLKKFNIGVVKENDELKTRIGFLESQLEERTKMYDDLLRNFNTLEKIYQWELNQLNQQFINFTNQSGRNTEELTYQIENLQKENLTIQMKAKNTEIELQKKTETHFDLLQKYHSLVKANQEELYQKESQFMNYKSQSEKNADSLRSQIGKLQREARSFRTKIGDLEWELGKKTKTHNDLLQKFSKIEKTHQNELNQKDREFALYRTQQERNIKSMKSKIEKIQRESNEYRKIKELEIEVDFIYRKKKRTDRNSSHEGNLSIDNNYY